MNNRVLLAGLAGGLAFFFVGWLVWGVLLMDTMRALSNPVAGCDRQEPVLWGIALSNLVWGLFFAVVYDRWARIRTFATGLRSGLWLAGLISLSIDLSMFAFLTSWTLPLVALDVAVNILVGGLVGGIVGWVLGYGNRE